jgi:DNA-binding transcriptional MerR regulator
MSVDTSNLTKLYYSIGEVADMFDVSTSLIRYWENEFSALRPHKNSKGDRRFTKDNIEQLNQIYHLVKERGFTLDGAKTELDRIDKKSKTKNSLLKKLKNIQKGLKNLKEKL